MCIRDSTSSIYLPQQKVKKTGAVLRAPVVKSRAGANRYAQEKLSLRVERYYSKTRFIICICFALVVYRKQEHITIPNFIHIKPFCTIKNTCCLGLFALTTLPRYTLQFGTPHDLKKDLLHWSLWPDSTQVFGTKQERTYYLRLLRLQKPRHWKHCKKYGTIPQYHCLLQMHLGPKPNIQK